MNVNEIVWIDVVVEKIWKKHHVTIEEVEEVLNSHPRLRRMMKGDVRGENMYGAFGRTRDGRRLSVFFIRKKDGGALIISARDMARKEMGHHEKK